MNTTRPTVELATLAIVTTAHLTREEARRWDGDPSACPLACADYVCYGWFVYTGDFRENLEREEWPGLFATLEAVEHTGARWLLLDCDADEIEGVPTYEW